MNSHCQLDCIVVGYNDVDFEEFSAKQRATRQHWGAYHEVQTNSVIFDGRRITFMDLMNRAITAATGSDPRLNVFEAPSLAVCYLSSFLQERGFNVAEVNFFNRDRERFAELLARGVRAVAITTTFYVEPEPVQQIVRFVREHNPETTIIVGGPHIYNTCSDYREDHESLDFILRSMGADIYINDSQGENTLSDVLVQLRRGAGAELAGVSNLIYSPHGSRDESGDGVKGAGMARTVRAVERNDLDANSVNWRHFSPDFIAPLTYLRTARSCPFSCSFCQYPMLAGPHVINEIDNVEQQLRALHEAGTTDVVFIDDTFNVPLPRFKKLLQMMIDNHFGFRWVSFLRCSNVDEQAIDLMAESGCVGALLGIESGDQQILDYMNKKVKIERYRWGIHELEKRNIATYASLICGFPGETARSVINTTEFIEETAPTFFNVQLYYHDKSAPIHRRAEEFGINGYGYSWSHNTMDWQQAIEWARYMIKNVHNSTFISLYGFSLWGISYLISKGISVEQVRAFGKATREMLFDSLADQDVNGDSVRQERLQRLTDVFRPRPQASMNKGALLAAVDEPFWQGTLASPPRPLVLASEPATRQGMDSMELVLGSELSLALQDMAHRAGTTTANVMLALFELYLYRLTRQEQIVVGVQTSKTTVPVITRLSENMELEDLLEAVIHSADQALDHQDHDLSALPRPNVLFAYGNTLGHAEPPRDGFDLRLVVERHDDRLRLALEYEKAMFSAEQIDQALVSLKRFSQMVAGPMAA